MKQFACITAMLLVLSACSRLTEANYAKLKSGMSYEEVTQILGRADRCDEAVGIKHCVWGNEESSVTAEFVGGKALMFTSKNIR
jgi:hypothetical protein